MVESDAKNDERCRLDYLKKDAYQSPSNDFLQDIFLHWYEIVKPSLLNEIKSVTGSMVGWDHTHHVASLVKLVDPLKNGQVCQFEGLLCILNETGHVMRFAITKTTSLLECSDIFQDILKSNAIELVITGEFSSKILFLKKKLL